MNGKILKKLALLLGMVVFLECLGLNNSELAFAKPGISDTKKNICYSVAAGVPILSFGIWGVSKLFSAAQSEPVESDELPTDRSNALITRIPPRHIDAEYINRIISDDWNINISDFEIINTGEEAGYTGITDKNLLFQSEYGKVAIIDAANTGGLGGGGVDGAIFQAMGKDARNDLSKNLKCYANSNMRIQEGGSVLHGAYGITGYSPNVSYVIQAVSPRLRSEHDLALFYSAWYNAVALGIEYECDTLVTAAIGMGVFCENKSPEFAEKCAKVALQAINDAKGSRNIHVVLTDHRDNRRNSAFFDKLRKIIINV